MLKRVLLLQLLLMAIGYSVRAQIPGGVSQSQLAQIKVDNLSDDQIRQLVAQMKKNNISYSQIDDYAAQRGIPDVEVAKLKARINQLNLDKELAAGKSNNNNDLFNTDTTGRQLNDQGDTIYYWREKYQQIK